MTIHGVYLGKLFPEYSGFSPILLLIFFVCAVKNREENLCFRSEQIISPPEKTIARIKTKICIVFFIFFYLSFHLKGN